MDSIPTEYGNVTLERLLEVYHSYKKQENRKNEKRKEFLQTPEGKEQNRQRAKSYYERNKEVIREKARSKYIKKADRQAAESPVA